MFELACASGLAVELLSQLIEQLGQARIGGGHHPTVSVVHLGRICCCDLGRLVMGSRLGQWSGRALEAGWVP